MTMGERRGRGRIPPSNVPSLHLHLNLNLLCHQGQSHRCSRRYHHRRGLHGNRDRKCRRRHLQTRCCTRGPRCLAPARCRGMASSRGGRSGSQPARRTPPQGRWSMGTSRCHVPRILARHRSWSCHHRFFAVGIFVGVVVIVAANVNTAARGRRGCWLAIVAAILRLIVAVVLLVSAIAITWDNDDKLPVILLRLV
jgi:hypothetical protein